MTIKKDMFRPRLTRNEILFLAEALRSYKQLMTQKQSEMEARQYRIKRLSDRFLHTLEGREELNRERARLSLDKQQDYFSQRLVASALVRRFEALAEGGRLHSGLMTRVHLEEFEMVPKTCRKS